MVRKRKHLPGEPLKDLCRIGGISNAGLKALLKKIRDQKEVADASFGEIDHEFHERFRRLSTTITLELTEGGTWDWPVVDPGLLLQDLLTECPSLFSLYAETMIIVPCTRDRPWNTFHPRY